MLLSGCYMKDWIVSGYWHLEVEGAWPVLSKSQVDRGDEISVLAQIWTEVC